MELPRLTLLRVVLAVFAVLFSRFLVKLLQNAQLCSTTPEARGCLCHHILGFWPSAINCQHRQKHAAICPRSLRGRSSSTTIPHLDSAFYLDIWPFGAPILLILKPDMMYQLTQENQIPKDHGIRNFLRPLTGEEDLVTLDGPVWKRWRAIFNPGFSASHIMTLVPGMVEEVEVFKDILKQYAQKGELAYLENASLNLTIDIIGRVSMDHKFNSQTKYNDMTSALRHQLLWCTTGLNMNPLQYINIFRPFVHKYNSYRMNRYISRELDERYNNNLAVGKEQKSYSKSVVDLALKAYVAENPSAPAFRDIQTIRHGANQVIHFRGHDTTSAAAVFTYHLLFQHPDVLCKVREEHDAVFGPDVSATSSILRTKPQLLNQLTYTLAAIKETLRIYPVVAALRDGQPDFHLVGDDGQRFPTEDCLIWGDHYAVHHNPKHWQQPEEFLPDRWLVPEGDPLYPPKNAWRPFERGPRNCIGQELALTEVKVMLALTLREFDIKAAYDEFDALKGNPKDWNVNGHRAYMVLRVGPSSRLLSVQSELAYIAKKRDGCIDKLIVSGMWFAGEVLAVLLISWAIREDETSNM